MAGDVIRREILRLAIIADEYPRDLRRQRVIRDRTQAFELDNFRFKRLFRISKTLALTICDRLQDQLMGQNALGIPPNVKILIALRFYAVGSYQLAIGQDLFLAVSQPTVSRCVASVSKAIVDIYSPEVIKFPVTDEEIFANKIGFSKVAGFPGIIGAIDGTQIAIVAPSINDEEYRENLYVNRKGFHSLNTQIICDHKIRIINCNARFPGSAHDSHVFRMSHVSTHLENLYRDGRKDCWLIGDSGYPLRPWLLTPITHTAEGSPEYKFDKALTQTRQLVECTIGLLKQVFRCLLMHRTLHYHPTAASRIVYACCTLHNMRRDSEHRPEDDVFTETEPSSDSDSDSEDEQGGARRRMRRRLRARRRQIRRERRALVFDAPEYVPGPNENWLRGGQALREHLVRRFL